MKQKDIKGGYGDGVDLIGSGQGYDIQTQVNALYNDGNDKRALEALQKDARQLCGKPQRQNDDIESENESTIKNLIELQNSQEVGPGQRTAMDDKEPLRAAEKHLQNNVNSVQAEVLKIEKKGHLPEVRINEGEGYLTFSRYLTLIFPSSYPVRRKGKSTLLGAFTF